MAVTTNNPLITSKLSENSSTVALHPLVLITVSDLITRHAVRRQQGPFAGILLGQQKGQEVTAESAFAANLVESPDQGWHLDPTWTATRIQQFKDVHKAPALDVVGWFALCPESGPLHEHVAIHKQITTLFSENGIFLAVHPTALQSTETTNRKLPVSIYETHIEGEQVKDAGQMDVDGQEDVHMKFRAVPYTVETDETEMISVNYISKGAGSAAAVDGGVKIETAAEGQLGVESKGKGKAANRKEQDPISGEANKSSILTSEEEDQIAGITTRLNSVKMLESRIQLITKFLQDLPASYLSDPSLPLTELAPEPDHLPHLRNIQALLTRLSLLTPTAPPRGRPDLDTQQRKQQSALSLATQAQSNDVALVSMLSQLGQNVQGLHELGRKFSTVDSAKSAKTKSKGGFNPSGYGNVDDAEARVGGFTLNNTGMLV